MLEVIFYLVIFISISSCKGLFLQAAGVDIGIKMCRMRNCTIAEDMRPSLARGGFSISNFGWFGLRTWKNSHVFYKTIGDKSKSMKISSGTIMFGSEAITQLLYQEKVFYPQLQVSPNTVIQVSGRYTDFPQIRTQVTATNAPVSMFYVAPKQKALQQKVSSNQEQFPSDLVVTIVPSEESESIKNMPQSPVLFPQLQANTVNSSSFFQNPQPQPSTPPEVFNVSPSPIPDQQVCIATLAARINATDQLSILYKALQASNLVEFLSNPQVLVTLFAPTDTAFESLLGALGDVDLNQLLENTQLITAILLLHIVPDFALTASQLKETRVLSTLLPNQNLTIGLSSSQELLQEVTTVVPPQVAASANILVPDVPACESLIHVIDGVLLGSTDDTLAARSALNIKLQQNPEVCGSFPPCCAEYTLKVGEIDCDVAYSYEINCEEFRDLNDISYDDDLQAGDLLQIC